MKVVPSVVKFSTVAHNLIRWPLYSKRVSVEWTCLPPSDKSSPSLLFFMPDGG